MRTFVLKTKDDEIINRVDAHDIDTATEMFAKIKKLKVEVLSSMFKVEKLTK